MQRGSKAYRIAAAERLSSVGEYYFSVKLKEIARLNAEGAEIINLGVGSPDLPPSESTIDTLCRYARQSDVHGYQPYVGIAELRKGFAEWYQRWYNVALDPDSEIQPLIGSKEGILHISLAFLNPGDGVLLPNPGYPTYAAVSRLVGARLLPYELKEENGWYPNLDVLERTTPSGVKLMWVNYPHMPTGAPASVELFERLVAFAAGRGILLVNDNPYSFILNARPLSLLSVPGAKETAIEMNSLSKSHNMPGWRMAMLASNARFVQWVLKVKSNVDSGQFKPMQYAAAEALRAPGAWYEAMNKVYRSRRAIVEDIMRALRCTFDEKQTGMFLWGKVPAGCGGGEVLADKALRDARVFIAPGFIFGSAGERYVRLSLCCNNDTLREALRRIQAM